MLTDIPNKKLSLKRVEELRAELQDNLPVWIRPPKSGVDHYCGFSRAKLYEEATRGTIRSVSIRQPGQVKGTRLFHLGSILAFIEKQEAAAIADAAALASA